VSEEKERKNAYERNRRAEIKAKVEYEYTLFGVSKLGEKEKKRKLKKQIYSAKYYQKKKAEKEASVA